ncbi:Nn.00g010310.m01.CDS01 [Neocucurbitaria sp. VM-36]
MDPTTVYTQVHSRYSATAEATPSSQHVTTVAEAFGYSAEDLASIPSGSNLGLSCGNPLALANLKEGETVIDLGCGAGFDVLLAARKLGEQGRVVGVDMNMDMLTKARLNASRAQISNVDFVHSRITSINLPDASADVIISNCVINLVPHTEKHLVFKEMHRLLKSGGRVAVSDILTRRPLPETMKNNVALYVGCIAGASSKDEYEAWLKEAGFADVLVVDAESDLNVYTRDEGQPCCGPSITFKEQKEAVQASCCGQQTNRDGGVTEDMRTGSKDVDLNEWAGSFKVFALKQ